MGVTGITGVNAGVVPAYDPAGNMISGPKPGENTTRRHYVYDAWNRLVAVHADEGGSQGDLIASYEYDGRNYRIEKYVEGTAVTYDYYYNDNWQVVEVRKDAGEEPVLEQYVWDVRYVDAPVLRDRDTDDDGVMDETLYYTNDANFNVTALVDADTGDVVERYMYDPYGKVTVLDEAWDPKEPNESAVANEILYSGYRYDGESGLFHVRNRYHDPSLGRFLDSDSERRIRQAMAEFVRGRTTLIVAHRFATVLSAARIVVMDAGRIVDVGPHEELLGRCPLYRTLYQTQLQDAGGAAPTTEPGPPGRDGGE